MFPLPSNRATRLGINILMLLAAGVALRLCSSVFVPTVIALLLACVLGPMAVWMHQRLKIRWVLACITVIFGLIMVNILVTFVLFASVLAQVRNLDAGEIAAGIEQVRKKAESLTGMQFEEGPTADQIQDTVRQIAPSIVQNTGLLGLEWLLLWFFILFLVFFMLLEGPVLVRRVVDVFGPSGELKAKAAEVLKETAHQIRTYIVWRTIINFGLAIVIGLVFQWGGLRQPWTWAVLLAILNYIPYLGPVVAGLPPLMDAFVSTEFHWLLILIAIYWAIIILEGYLIVPLVMGRSMDLNAVTVMLACLFWQLVWGMTGLFLAMPIMAGVKSVCMHVPGWRPWANLMSAEEIDVKSEGVADAITDDASPTDAMLNAPPASPNGEAERAAAERALQP